MRQGRPMRSADINSAECVRLKGLLLPTRIATVDPDDTPRFTAERPPFRDLSGASAPFTRRPVASHEPFSDNDSNIMCFASSE